MHNVMVENIYIYHIRYYRKIGKTDIKLVYSISYTLSNQIQMNLSHRMTWQVCSVSACKCKDVLLLMHIFPRLCSAFPVMSENYIVFIEQPIKLDLLKFMLYRIQGKSFHKVMTWEPKYETIFHLVNRHTGKVS